MVATFFSEGRGYSLNAIDCHKRNCFSASRCKKEISKIKEILRFLEPKKLKKIFSLFKKRLEKKLNEPADEWHHVGKYAKKCDYYDIDFLFLLAKKIFKRFCKIYNYHVVLFIKKQKERENFIEEIKLRHYKRIRFVQQMKENLKEWKKISNFKTKRGNLILDSRRNERLKEVKKYQIPMEFWKSYKIGGNFCKHHASIACLKYLFKEKK